MAKRKRRKSYGYADYTDDSLEAGQMAVIRASYQKDCKGAEDSFDKLKKMSSFVVQQDSKREKSVAKLISNTASYVGKACKR